MTISPDILAKQAAYAARPFAAYVNTSDFSTAQRFDTEGEAVAYLFQMLAVTRRYIHEAKATGDRRWIGMDLWRSYLEGPQGKVQARFVVLMDRCDRDGEE